MTFFTVAFLLLNAVAAAVAADNYFKKKGKVNIVCAFIHVFIFLIGLLKLIF